MADLNERILFFDRDTHAGHIRYIRSVFAPEDDALIQVRRNTVEQSLPEIQIRPEEGQMLQFLAAAVGATRILEIGALAGYSGIWLARGLKNGGRLTTLERDPNHARVAREHFALAGVTDRVTLIEGDAHHTLAQIDGGEPFDMVFIDADKESNARYVEWALRNVRPGGLITVHNAFREGKLLSDHPDGSGRGTLEMLQMLATHERLTGTIIPVGDGIAAAIVR